MIINCHTHFLFTHAVKEFACVSRSHNRGQRLMRGVMKLTRIEIPRGHVVLLYMLH